MKKLIIVISSIFLAQTIYAQWVGIPMPNLTPPSGTPYNLTNSYLVNHPDTIVGELRNNVNSRIIQTFYYSSNRGQTYTVLFGAQEGFSIAPPITLKTGGTLFGRIYFPNNDFTAWDTTVTAPLFKNLKVDPWWYKRHGNYLEDSVGYFVNNSSPQDTLFKSTDLGITKTVVLDSITRKLSNGAILKKIFVLDKNHVWARRNYPSSVPWALGSLQLLYRTRDGGATWQRVATNLDTINEPVKHIYDIYFVSPDTGFLSCISGSQITGTSELYRTTNGGGFWTKIAEMPLDAGIGVPFDRLFFVNSKIGFSYGVANGIVRKTTDGGYTWHPQPSLPTTGYREMSLVGNNVIWVRNSGGGLYYTTTMGDATVGLDDATLQNQLSVTLYPNPAQQGKFNINWDASERAAAHVKIYDVMGKLVFDTTYPELQTGEQQLSIELDVKPGVYYVRMQQGSKFAIRSVVISR
jgi:photosystem II stability/assembly factor-like uncharacterized protein